MSHEKAITLQARLLRHPGEWLVFSDDPRVPPTNNLAERALRPLIVLRRITFGSRCRLDSDAKVAQVYRQWSAERDEFHKKVAAGDPEAIKAGWQKDYFQGRDPGREQTESHQTKLTVRPFD